MHALQLPPPHTCSNVSSNPTQAENLRSFQLLQEYLEQARRPSNGSPAFRTPFRFQFFLKPQPQQFYDGLGTYGSENDGEVSGRQPPPNIWKLTRLSHRVHILIRPSSQ